MAGSYRRLMKHRWEAEEAGVLRVQEGESGPHRVSSGGLQGSCCQGCLALGAGCSWSLVSTTSLLSYLLSKGHDIPPTCLFFFFFHFVYVPLVLIADLSEMDYRSGVMGFSSWPSKPSVLAGALKESEQVEYNTFWCPQDQKLSLIFSNNLKNNVTLNLFY